MDLPWGTLAGIALISFVVSAVLSLFTGLVVAHAAEKPAWIGLLVAVFVPVVGPVIWGVVEYAGMKKAGYSSRGTMNLRDTLTITGGLWWSAAALMLVALFVPWLSADATVDTRFSGVTHLSPIDSVVGAVALGGSALILLASAFLVGWMAQRRLAVINLLGAGTLFWVTVVSLRIYGVADHAGSTVATFSGYTVRGNVSAGPALWLTLGAAVVTAAGSLVAVVRPPTGGTAATPVLVGTDQSGSGSDDWGDSGGW